MHFDSIKHFYDNSKQTPITEAHREVFRFYTLEELKQLDISNYK